MEVNHILQSVYDWTDLVTAVSNPLEKFGSTFILAPRQISIKRFKQIIKQYLPKGNIILGIAQEEFIQGFEGQPQFRTLELESVEKYAYNSNSKLIILKYPQSEILPVIQKLNFRRAVIVNGSFHRSFHLRLEYQAILDKGASIKYISPFTDETEAQEFANKFVVKNTTSKPRAKSHHSEHVAKPTPQSDSEFKNLISVESSRSFETSFQTAAAIVTESGEVICQHNIVAPYETYAWHHGFQREKHKSQAGDSSHYDSVHAETAALLLVGLKAKGAKLYCCTFPCPHCARNIVFAGISEVIYELDYGDKYGYNLFDKSGVKYRRFHE